jgi:acyl-CoA reductase-like NAD-dependent aldehyde dehydrogenase
MMPMFVGGRWTTGSATSGLVAINPATEEVLGEVPRGGAADIDLAVQAARRAFDHWRRLPAAARAARLHGTAAALRAGAAALAEILTREGGKPLRESEEEVASTQVVFDYYAELARHEGGRVVPAEEADQIDFVLREPYGVVGCLVPWNYPLLLLAWKIAPALAAGNTVVLKPSEYASLATLRFVEAAFADYPPGVVNVVTGEGAEAGAALVAHPDVALIAFTGSLATGHRVAELAARQLKRVHLELGGKDPFVVGPDADLDTAARAALYAGLLNAGQVCTSAERLYVPAERCASFVDRLCGLVETLKVGDGLDPDTDVGPLVRPQYIERIEAQLAEAVAQGARVLVGGRRPAEPRRGFFFSPTVVVDVNHRMSLMREETFGPVLPVMPYRGFDEAIALANDTIYGLGATLLTHDARLVKRFVDEVRAGTVWINDPLNEIVAAPFGGMKMSGGAREWGQEGLDAFVQVKHVHWDLGARPKSYWYPRRPARL